MRRRLRPALVALEDRTAPAVFTVLTLNDAGANSLRDCVAKANAAFGPDTVNFDMALSGTVTLTTGEIAVNDATSFVGPGSSVIAISGNNASRIFNLIAAPAGTAIALSGLTLTAGKVGTGVNGGAIVGDNEALSLSQCVLTGNSAGGSGGVLYASGGLSLSADGCTFASNSAFNAGGVLVNINSSKTVLNACAISGNTAGRTGGIYVTSYLLVSGSTIANNKSTNTSIGGGGGIRAVGTFPAGGLTIRNSTISGNSAASQGGGGVMLNSFSGTLVVQNSTITNNSVTGPGGGVARLSGTGTVQLDSTIIAQNTSTAGTPDLSFNAATAVTANNSIIGVADKGSFTLSGTGNQSGTLALPFNANLGKLGDYGGPMQTHRLLVGSPALDKGSNPAGLTTDQRGFARVFGGVPDVGAVEINPQGFVVDQPVDESDGNIVTGDISLREAIEMASDFSATADTITFASNTFADDPFDFTYAVKLTLGQMTIRGPTEINWVEKYPLTIDANGASRVFNLQFAPTGSAIGFTGLRITGGKAIEGGGILGGHENLTLTNCVITGNTATSFGGGGVAQLGDGVLTAVDCAFTDNTASGTGGAFETFGYKSKTTLTRCTISGNTAFQGAGGYARYELIAEGCAVFGNTTTTDVGGGFLVRYGPATIRNSTISGNTAKNFGGGVALGFDFAGTLLVENSTIVNNAAQTSQGGGIIRLGNVATISIASSIVSGNSAPQFPDIRSNGTVNVNFSAVGDPNGFVPTGGNNLPFGTNLKLGALQLNGGPTPTHALLVGSPAVDAGSNPAGLTTDQRGTVYARTVNPGTDIGAYETAKVTLVTNTNDSGPGSLRQAALDAIFSPGQAALVRFDPTVFAAPQTITLTSGQISLFYNVEIQGPGAGLVTISGNNSSAIFFTGGTLSPAEAIFSGLTLTGGKGSHGGAIGCTGQTVIIRDCVVSGNTATSGGGGISINTGRLVMERCTVANNTGGKFGGGGLYFFSRSTFLISDSTITGNKVTGSFGGGGVYFFNASYAPAVMRNCTVSGNTSAAPGGGIALNFRGNLVLQNTTVTKNTSTAAGGGIGRFGGQGDVTLQSTVVAQNTGTGGPDINFQAVIGTVFADNSIIGVANAGNLTITGAGNQNGSLALPLDAKLSSLQNFGGPTLTHIPLAGSPTVDKGSNVAKLVFDQRGLGRVFGTAADVGSVEVHPVALAVDIALDENDGNFGVGDLSLREALALANASAATADTITFDPAVFGSLALNLNLTLGELAVSGPVNVIGPGADLLTISGLNASRIFITTSAPAATEISMSGLRLTSGKGDFGGAIRGGDERLTFTDCVLTANAATSNGGAVYINAGGWLTATNCAVTNNTAGNFIGGVDVFGTGAKTVLRQCSVSGNVAADGGGIYTFGYLLVENSTVSNNAAKYFGGGVYASGAFATGALTIRNSTISGNSAKINGGGIVLANFSGTLDLQNSTVTNNTSAPGGGGIARTSGTGTVNLASTIVAQNTGTAPDLSFNAATSVTANNSIIGAADKGNFSVIGSNNQTGSAAAPVNAKLGALADNGGPTQSHLPQTGSPALNKGANTLALATDQRGAPRTAVVGTDMGAVEVQAAAGFDVDITADENDGNFGVGDLSLREALALASGSVESEDTITFDAAVFGTAQTITLTLGEIAIGGPVLVEGPSTKLLTLSGNNASRIFNTSAAPLNTLITLTDMTFTAGFTRRSGGAIVAVNEKLQLADCVFTGNASTGGSLNGGGAVAVYSVGSLEATDCTFTSNTAAKGDGGAILALRINAPTLSLRNCTITGNLAAIGGGIHSTRHLLLEDSTVSGNTATAGPGGGIFLYPYNSPGAIVGVIRNSTISGNSAMNTGGGIGLFTDDPGTLLVQNTTITANTASSGGGISLSPSITAVDLQSAIVTKNTATTGPDLSGVGTVNATACLIGSTPAGPTFNPDATTTALLGADPLLGPLAANGGPTQTHALLPGSPAINAGSNSAALANDQRGPGFPRVFNGKTDIGAFELQSLPSPSKISSVQVNDSSAQRSRVSSLLVTFDQPPSLPANPAEAFQLKRQSDDASVSLAGNILGNSVTLTFTGGPLDFASLADGRYTLTALASKITNFDGNGDGTPGDDFVLVGTPANGLFRLFGDGDGDGDVDATDFGGFRQAFGTTTNLAFDFDNDGDIDAADFAAFRGRFGVTV